MIDYSQFTQVNDRKGTQKALHRSSSFPCRKTIPNSKKGKTSSDNYARGVAFLEFTEHEHALVALRVLNNNLETFGPEYRPIVEFALHNVQTLKLRNFKLQAEQERRESTENGQQEAASQPQEAATCNPSGKVRGKKPPPGQCNTGNDSDCCVEGKMYTVYECSPPVSQSTKATLTINSFEKGKDGGGPSECDHQYHSDDTPIVALSTGWFNKRSRCHHMVNIRANGKSVKAMVVDECDSTRGCDAEHDYQPPCQDNIVDASKAVWKALGVNEGDSDWGWMDIEWSDA